MLKCFSALMAVRTLLEGVRTDAGEEDSQEEELQADQRELADVSSVCV